MTRSDDVLIRVLGPLEVRGAQQWQRLGSPKWRSLLARLAATPGTPVSLDALIDTLWPDDPPRAAVNQVHGYVSRLRRALGDDDRRLLATHSPGYELAVGPDDLDSGRFEQLADRGEEAHRAGEHDRAAELLSEALGLWRGPAYADVPAGALVRAEADRLDERRLSVQEARIDADLARGRPAGELVPELRAFVESHPLRERGWEQLMLTLHRAGRQADALLAYRTVYDHLDAELGVAPGDRLVALHRRMLAGDPALTPGAPGGSESRTELPRPEVPRQLPADVADFTGRRREVDEVLRWCASALDGAGVPPVLALTGGGGVGKTALAVHAAHRVADRFPDGQLYVDLRGFSPTPALDAGQALALFLRALGVAPDRVPLDVVEASALFRTRLAGRRVLIVLDNARDHEQVLPFLPGDPSCLTLITSRDPMAGLVARGSAVRSVVGPMDRAEAKALLVRGLGECRAEAEPGAVDELTDLCAGLPLATRIAAANLAGHAEMLVADQVSGLRGEEALPRLEGADDRPDGSVRATFDLSYHRLGPAAARAFVLVALIPGDDFDDLAAAALLDAEAQEARRTLDALCDRGMLGYVGRRRYALHDLLRSYARERGRSDVPPADRLAAEERVFAWYVAAADQAVRRGLPPLPRLPGQVVASTPLPELTDDRAAVDWLESERTNLRALAEWAAVEARLPVWQLADVLRGFYFYRRHTLDWRAVAECALASAVKAGSLAGEAAAELSLAQANRALTDYPAAARHAERGLALAQESGWTEGVASLWNEVAVAQLERGDIGAGIDPLRRAVDLYQELGDRQGEARMRMNLGLAVRQLGDLPGAAREFERVADLLPDPAGHANAMNRSNLGETYRLMGRLDEARREVEAAYDVLSGAGHPVGLASTLAHLAGVAADEGHTGEAISWAQQSLAQARTHRSLRLEGSALVGLAEARMSSGGDPGPALGEARAAEEATRAAGASYEWVESLVALARVQLRMGEVGSAAATARQAATEARPAGYRLLLAQALSALAWAEWQSGDPDAAAAGAARASDLHGRCGHTPGIADMGRLLADISAATGD
jgi:DNA-binding SARP family transcriptional activator/tetratricopeptide (TPR) repeat protein